MNLMSTMFICIILNLLVGLNFHVFQVWHIDLNHTIKRKNIKTTDTILRYLAQ